MSLRIFADHCVPRAIIQQLLSADYDVLQLRDYLPIESPDHSVIAKAQELDAILLSLNGDFADIVQYPPSKYKGIIAIQLKNHPEIIPSLMQRLIDYLSTHSDMGHYQGKLIIVEAHRIRIRT